MMASIERRRYAAGGKTPVTSSDAGGMRIRPLGLLAKAAITVAWALLLFLPSAAAAGVSKEKGTVVLSLEKAIAMGLENDEVLRQAQEGVEGAAASLEEAKSGRLPQLTISGSYGRNIQKPVLFLPSDMAEAFGGATKIELGEDNDIIGNAQLTLNLWTAGRLSAGIGASTEMAEASRKYRSATENLVRYRVSEAYFGVLLAEEGLRISQKALEATVEAERVTQAGYDEGTVSRFDLLRARVELENRRPQVIQSQNDLAGALTVLKRRCDIDPDAVVVLSDTLEAVDGPEDLDYLIGVMNAGNPELLALNHQAEALKQNLRFERAERWPVLQLGASYTVQGQWSDKYMPENENLARFSSVTLGFQIPVFDGFRARSRIDRARSELRTAEIELERATLEKEMAVRVSRLTLENAISALEGRRQAVDLAEEAHRLALVRMRNGLATPLERLDAELAMTMARSQLAQALYACNVARAALDLVVGTGASGKKVVVDEKESGNE